MTVKIKIKKVKMQLPLWLISKAKSDINQRLENGKHSKSNATYHLFKLY